MKAYFLCSKSCSGDPDLLPVSYWEYWRWILLFWMSPYKITSMLHHCENVALCQTPDHCKIQVLLWPSWATAPGSGGGFDSLVLMNFCFLLHTFCISSSGIRCIYLCHTETFLVIFLFVILLETVKKEMFVQEYYIWLCWLLAKFFLKSAVNAVPLQCAGSNMNY